MSKLEKEVKQCTFCEPNLPLGANPIVSFTAQSKILLISQAPGRIAHEKNKAWDDPSGKVLKSWLGVNDTEFYDKTNFAIFPMGFCYPGKGVSGDLPPKKVCAEIWHEKVMNQFENVQLKILIGGYSQNYYLETPFKTLTERVKNFEKHLPEYFVLPHPSPRNRFWRQKNPWFEEDIVPKLQKAVRKILAN